MSQIIAIFENISKLIQQDGQNDFIQSLLKNLNEASVQGYKVTQDNSHQPQLLEKIVKQIDELTFQLRNDKSILISVKNQKLLRTSFQIVTCLGFSTCLIPGLGISLTKRCSSATILPPYTYTDKQKYEILVLCTDFFTRCYTVPVLKSIINTFHLSDYLAALIQLSFAPLKKPGVYSNFTMTEDMYRELSLDRQKYVLIYEQLVTNCFQPIVMKELLVLQSVNPQPPAFVKRVISKEMSKRLLASGGLLSLIRCFIESYQMDTGFEWKKINLICKIVAHKHGNDCEENYLNNICSQLIDILTLSNTHYLTTSVACALHLHEKYPQSDHVSSLIRNIFESFHCNSLSTKLNFPGTFVLSPQELNQKLNVLHSSVCSTKIGWPKELMLSNLNILFLLGIKCTKNEEFKTKIRDVLLKCLSEFNKTEILAAINEIFLGNEVSKLQIAVEEFDAGLAIKCTSIPLDYPKSDAVSYFLCLFKSSTDNAFVEQAFKALLSILIQLSETRNQNHNKKNRNSDVFENIISETDEYYANILQLLSEICTSPKVVTALKTNTTIVVHFIQYYVSNSSDSRNEECVTVALILLITILTSSDRSEEIQNKFSNMIPVLKQMTAKSDFNSILYNEALSLLLTKEPQQPETKCSKAISEVFDRLLPVRAHGIMELTRLIEVKDNETLSKKHYIFCIFQEQLKDSDSYVYLACINGLAALGSHFTEDVLQVLCKEFLQISTEQTLCTKEDHIKIAELRMKIGDVIVKVTKGLGEMAVVHKSLLLNTMLCGCRDEDPLIRTSALSNLAEIAHVLHYKIGTIIYEVLFCIWSIIETDKALECRRAAVMVITSLLKGLGKYTLVQLKENLLPIYRKLKNIYIDSNEDSVLRLHAQLALEELNESVHQFLFPELKMKRNIFVLDEPENVFQ